jgi:hypothetical protein
MKYSVEIEETLNRRSTYYFTVESIHVFNAAQEALNQYNKRDRNEDRYDDEPDFRITSIKEVA